MSSEPDPGSAVSPPPKNLGGRPRRTDWQEPFFENFVVHGIKAWSAHAAKVSVDTVDEERKRDPEFAARYREAFERSTAGLERAGVELATSGLPWEKTTTRTYPKANQDGTTVVVTETTVVRGRLIYPPMLMFLLKARRPDVYREQLHVEQTGKDGGPVEVTVTREEVDAAAAEFSARVVRLADVRRAAGGAPGDGGG